jgi:hypothetical protein
MATLLSLSILTSLCIFLALTNLVLIAKRYKTHFELECLSSSISYPIRQRAGQKVEQDYEGEGDEDDNLKTIH